MRVVLIGADFEENLGVGMIAAAAEAAGHSVSIVPFNATRDAERIASEVAAVAPDVVGLSIQFQHRAHEFLSLARRLRRHGFEGHLTAGGQFPTLAHREVLGRGHGVDSVVLHDGEQTFVELLGALEARSGLEAIPGLALNVEGEVRRTQGRGLTAALDALPFPKRYRPPSRHAGVPFVPIMGSRGCWGSCSYCSITSFYRDAKAHGGGPTLRMRSPDNIAEEMATLTHALGESCVFCFHDDNFLLPRPADSLARVEAMTEALAARGVEKVGIIGKCRPETLTEDLAVKLRQLGVVRLYVGVENVADLGAHHLNRGVQHTAVESALSACEKADIFSCYNLLIFEPEATLDDVRQNVQFIRAHASHPVNFCRAEPYYGTPMQLDLAGRGEIGGSYLGWNYRIADARAELLFRIAAAAFRERNFRCDGVANRYMGVGYAAKLCRHFHSDVGGRVTRLEQRAESLTRAISLDTAALLEKAIAIAENADLADFDRIERSTALLGLEVAASDRVWQRELDQFYADLDAFVRLTREPRHDKPPRPRPTFARHLVIGASLALWAVGCGGETHNAASDPLPGDGGYDANDDQMVADPLPGDSGYDATDDQMVADPVPDDAGIDADDAGDDSMVADPPPPDAGIDGSAFLERDTPSGGKLRLIDQWTDSAPKRAVRSRDLPLFDPPDIQVVATRDGTRVDAKLVGAPPGATTRWESEGVIEGDGHEVSWVPSDDIDDSLRVAVRTSGGIAIVSVRAKSVRA